MTHQEAINIRMKLGQASLDFPGFELNMSIRKHLLRLEKHIKPLTEMEEKIREPLKEYFEEVQKIQREAATVDGEVKTTVVNGVEQYVFAKEKQKQVMDDLAKLDEKHKEALDVFNEKWKEYIEFLNTGESEFTVKKIDLKHVPEDINGKQLGYIWDLLNVAEEDQ